MLNFDEIVILILTLCQNGGIMFIVTRCQNNFTEVISMKKNIGSKLALYPMPITVIGAMNGDKPTWTLVGHLGIIGHDRVMVSLAAPHFINAKIKETESSR